MTFFTSNSTPLLVNRTLMLALTFNAQIEHSKVQKHHRFVTNVRVWTGLSIGHLIIPKTKTVAICHQTFTSSVAEKKAFNEWQYKLNKSNVNYADDVECDKKQKHIKNCFIHQFIANVQTHTPVLCSVECTKDLKHRHNELHSKLDADSSKSSQHIQMTKVIHVALCAPIPLALLNVCRHIRG